MDFPTRLRAVIGEGTTIDEFAALLGEPPQRIKDVLRAKQKPPIDLLLKLQVHCGVDLNWLVTGVGKEPEITAREASLLANYRNTDKEGQRSIERSAMLESQRQASGPEVAKRKKAA